ncbi:MAG: protein TolQ [Halothiobacillaceae bacterium]|nr:MAG: protein TolQ [Halothiobacillaceae bacterium]
MSIVGLIGGASPLVQGVMLLLLMASIVSWMIIVHKRGQMKRARAEIEAFEEKFWSGVNLSDFYHALTRDERPRIGMASLFEAGFREFARLRRQDVNHDPAMLLEGAQRGMKVALTREMDRLEDHLPVLATIGSISPYVGLFGTVWGIMSSFMGLANAGNTTLQAVAPGIAEALVATAMGLFAAIPAVVAYNRYTNDVDRLFNRLDGFQDEFLSLLHRQGASRPAA